MSWFAQCARRRRASDKKSWVSGVDNEFKTVQEDACRQGCCHRSQLCPHGFAKHESYGWLGTRNLPYASHDHCVWQGVSTYLILDLCIILPSNPPQGVCRIRQKVRQAHNYRGGCFCLPQFEPEVFLSSCTSPIHHSTPNCFILVCTR